VILPFLIHLYRLCKAEKEGPEIKNKKNKITIIIKAKEEKLKCFDKWKWTRWLLYFIL
jgi:hypothetical protein